MQHFFNGKVGRIILTEPNVKFVFLVVSNKAIKAVVVEVDKNGCTFCSGVSCLVKFIADPVVLLFPVVEPKESKGLINYIMGILLELLIGVNQVGAIIVNQR